MVMRLIDNASAVQMDLLEWGTQTHAPGALKRIEQRRRDREERRERRRHEERPDDAYLSFEGTMRAVVLNKPVDAVEHPGQMALPGMEAALAGADDTGETRGRRLDLEA